MTLTRGWGKIGTIEEKEKMAKYESSRRAAKWWADKIREGLNPAGYHMAANMAYGGASMLISPGFADDIGRRFYNITSNCIDRFEVLLANKLDEYVESGKGDDLLISSSSKPKEMLRTLSGRKNPCTGTQDHCKLLMDVIEQSRVPAHLIPNGITMWFSKDRVTATGAGKTIYENPTASKPASAPVKGSDGGRV